MLCVSARENRCVELQREFGRRVRELRMSRGLTQRELGERCGDAYPAQRIGEIERGNMNVTLATLAAISVGLGCEALDLFLFDETAAGQPPKLQNRRLEDLWSRANEKTRGKVLRIVQELLG